MATRGPGRPVSTASRQAVLTTAGALLQERGWRGFTIDEVARRSGVSKATIYKHWTGGLDVAAEALGAHVTSNVPTADPDAVEDVAGELVDQVRRLAAFYATPQGRLVAQLLGASISHEDGPTMVAARFFAARRRATRDLVDAGKSRGQLRDDVETDLVVDLLFGPIVFRMFNGLGPLPPESAERLAAVAMSALTR